MSSSFCKGFEPGQRIVTSANFLIDSESQLQAASGFVCPASAGRERTRRLSRRRSAQAKSISQPIPNPPHKGNNTFRVKLTGPGAADNGADVSVTFFMPAMPAMGMAAMTTTAKLTGKGNGVYEGTVRSAVRRTVAGDRSRLRRMDKPSRPNNPGKRDRRDVTCSPES